MDTDSLWALINIIIMVAVLVTLGIICWKDK